MTRKFKKFLKQNLYVFVHLFKQMPFIRNFQNFQLSKITIIEKKNAMTIENNNVSRNKNFNVDLHSKRKNKNLILDKLSSI